MMGGGGGGVGSLHHFIFGIVEAFGYEVDGLVLGDGVLLEGGAGRVERADLGLIPQAILELAEGGQETGAVGAQLPALPAQSVLHREPVTLSQNSIKSYPSPLYYIHYIPIHYILFSRIYRNGKFQDYLLIYGCYLPSNWSIDSGSNLL